ncbi:MAG: SusD/RagB family nutrient-binding outer membrane lipoprotein [Tannerellaceae bacterium]|jgi:hypothetical protein|nr:SusD/RagB family nutrient-binding outer membrane lipoprotein [Tannerellaceae bacterium]
MKQIFSLMGAVASAAVFALSGCSDTDYTDRYPDPSKTSKVTCDKLMTGVFETAKDYTMPTYNRYFCFETQQIGRFAQTMGWVNATGMYQGMGELYNNNRWKNFYNTLTQFRLLEHTYKNLPEASRTDNEVFVLLSKVFLYEQLQQIVDLWGDVPFSEAGYLAVTSEVKSSYPGYEKAETIYRTMLDDLKAINKQLAGMNTLPALASAALPAQDYINGGDVSKWRKYANSLRLRMAMRLASNGSMTADAREILKEMLENPAEHPVVGNNGENIKIAADKDGFNMDGTDHVGGLESWSGAVNRASKMMLDALKEDPRLPVIYDPNAENLYTGLDPRDPETQQRKLFERPASEGGNYYSAMDTATFSRNYDFPGILMTAAEVSFIQAEAFLKGYASGNAQEAFEKGVKESVEFYYELNSTATYRKPTPAPTAAEIAAFARAKWDGYSAKEVGIATQKWLHFSLIQMVEAWNEVRRTGIPELYFQTDNGSISCPNVPARLKYPTDERNNNPEKYAAVQAQDTYYTKLFWAK